MWVTNEFVKATTTMKEREAERARLVSEARRQARPDMSQGAWRWRVEPGMDGAFQNLLGWLLSSQRNAPVEAGSAEWQATPQTPKRAPSPGMEQAGPAANGERSPWFCCAAACCAGG